MSVGKQKRYTDGERRIRGIAKQLWDEDFIRSVFRGYPPNRENADYGWYVQLIINDPIFLGYSVKDAEQELLAIQHEKERILPQPIYINEAHTELNHDKTIQVIERLSNDDWIVVDYGYSEAWIFIDEWQQHLFTQEYNHVLEEVRNDS